MSKTTYRAFAIFSFFILSLAPALHAQTSTAPTGIVSAPGQLFNCFDQYDFGSVQVILNASSMVANAGATVPVTATVINNNKYPVVDGAIYVKIFKTTTPGQDQAQAGDVVDQFYAVQNINLAGGAQTIVSFNWKIPAYAVTGGYQVVPYFLTDGKFNLLGLTFTDDIHGLPLNMTLNGTAKGSVSFDKTSVQVDGTPYLFAAFIPQVSATTSVPITATLRNTTSADETVSVVAHVYLWDAASASNLLHDIPLSVTVGAGKSITVPFTVPADNASIELVVIDAAYQDTHSILNVRFGRSGVAYPRINFPALSDFPLTAGQPVTLFSCFHSASVADNVSNAKVVLTVTDDAGNVVASSVYNGPVTGNMMGMETSFTPNKNYGKLTITAETSVGGVIADRAAVHYDCSTIIGAVCPVGPAFPLAWAIIIGIVAVVLLLSILLAHRQSKLSHEVAATLIFILAVATCMGIYKVASGASLTNSNTQVVSPPNGVTVPISFSDKKGVLVNDVNGPEYQGGTISTSVAYGGNIINADTGAIIDTASPQTVSIGTHVRFVPSPFQNNNISWFLAGGGYDSPYGYWGESGNVTPSCSASDEVSISGGGYGLYEQAAFRPMTITEPSIQIVQRGTAGLTQTGADTYTVTSPGTIIADMVFGQTQGTIEDQDLAIPAFSLSFAKNIPPSPGVDGSYVYDIRWAVAETSFSDAGASRGGSRQTTTTYTAVGPVLAIMTVSYPQGSAPVVTLVPTPGDAPVISFLSAHIPSSDYPEEYASGSPQVVQTVQVSVTGGRGAPSSTEPQQVLVDGSNVTVTGSKAVCNDLGAADTFTVPKQTVTFNLIAAAPAPTTVGLFVVPVALPVSDRNGTPSSLAAAAVLAQSTDPEQAVVFWNVQNATSCTPSTNPPTSTSWWDPTTRVPSTNNFIKNQSGTPNTSANTTTDYTLTCTGLDGLSHSATARLTIPGTPDPTVPATNNPGVPASPASSSPDSTFLPPPSAPAAPATSTPGNGPHTIQEL